MHLFHCWREVHPDGKPPPHRVTYQQCARCDARRVLDGIGGYRGGKSIEDHWVATGEWVPMAPPRRTPSATARQTRTR